MSSKQNDKVAALPIRMTTTRVVLAGYVAFASLGLIFNIYNRLSTGHVAIWLYEALLAAIIGAGLFSLYWQNRSLSQALHLNSWVNIVCVGVMVVYALRTEPFESMAVVYMFHIGIFTMGLVLGFKTALQYATVVSLFLLGLTFTRSGISGAVLMRIVLAYAVALPSKLVERLIEESTAELTKINAQLNQEIVERKRAEEEVRRHRDHLEDMVTARTAELAAANEQLRESQQQLATSYQREQEKRQLSDTLRDVAKIVSGTLDRQEVVDLILAQLEKVVHYHYAAVSVLSQDQLSIVAQRAEAGGGAAESIFPVHKYPLNAQALREGRPLLIPDTARDEHWRKNGWPKVRSFINAPLLVKKRPVGILSVGRCDETPYTPDDAQTVFAFASQVAVALEQARLHQYELEQMERELDIARQVQLSLLPLDVPQFAGLDIAGCSYPARVVGGDFYNYFTFERGLLGIAVGDVSGKGLQAALMMALSFGLLSTEVRREIAPGALLAALNHDLYPHTQRNNLNTALTYMTLRPDHRAWDLRVSNAGLVSPLVRKRDGDVDWLNVRGLPLGAMEGVRYLEMRQGLQPGDAIVLCSDGAVEAMNDAGEMYGFGRLIACLKRAPQPATACGLLDYVLASVRAFENRAEAYDDLTLVVIVCGEPGR